MARNSDIVETVMRAVCEHEEYADVVFGSYPWIFRIHGLPFSLGRYSEGEFGTSWQEATTLRKNASAPPKGGEAWGQEKQRSPDDI